METIKDSFKAIRIKQGLSQEEFGKMLGLSKVTISNIERGTRNVTSKHIKLLSSIFGIDERWIASGEFSSGSKPLETAVAFDDYLISLGYSVTTEKTGESEEGYYEQHLDRDGNEIGKTWIPDEEYYSISVSKGKTKYVFTDYEYSDFIRNVEKFIEFELYKQNSDSE